MGAVSRLHGVRGTEALYRQQIQHVLETLRDQAVIQSTESSNRIEGIEAAPGRIHSLVQGTTAPQTRSEQEIAGYRDVLATLHASAQDIPFTPNLVLQLHRDLFRYAGGGGAWKNVDNAITERHPNGTEHVRFQTVPAFLTDGAMHTLHERFNAAWREGEVDRLLLIAAYVLDFLCIHPFLDGNGRMARLLTLLLLYHAGYDVGRYVSLEALVERTKESYYETLYASSQGWHANAHTLLPWTEYFLGVLTAAYATFEERVGVLRTARGAKTELVREAALRIPDGFRISELIAVCPGVSRPMVQVVLRMLQKEGLLRKKGAGGGTRYFRV